MGSVSSSNMTRILIPAADVQSYQQECSLSPQHSLGILLMALSGLSTRIVLMAVRLTAPPENSQ